MIRKIFLRNVLAYALLAGVFTFTVDHTKVFNQRSKYLLGIFYNGYFKNYKDGVVYFDYMIRQEPHDPQNYANLAICYKELGDTKRGAK
ncbi:MAG TPA: hypothetical protein VI955_00230 [Candidatus Omnitrophota bacterium]|nr:hypothetical protein [Candidatus Omnitrophota bacterium]